MKYKTVTVTAISSTDCYADINVPEHWHDQRILAYARGMCGGDFVPYGDWAGDWKVKSDVIHKPYDSNHFHVEEDEQ